MANPTYEGLGFLNFVATYHDSWADTNAGHQGHRFQSSYAKAALYENAGKNHYIFTKKKSWRLNRNFIFSRIITFLLSVK